ncbi:MAG: serine hydrolase [Candidatus Eremiobacteraeota bacterium]|nr:serine hydrolase [Candidatus Eremiobacteraeota bacterium]MCW5869476.1 serine hydrolase [Candidatus Eremiobacteraeota bacterium]
MRPFLLLLCLLSCTQITLAQRADKLKKTVQSLISRAQVGDCAVSIVDLHSEERVDLQGDTAYPLASVFKVPVMVELARQMQTQQSPLQLSTPLVMKAADRCIGSGSLQHRPVGSSASVQQLIEWMETKSDNTATDMLFRRIGLTSVDTYLASLGCTSSQIFLTNRSAWLISLGQSSDFRGLKPRQIADKWNRLDRAARLAAALRAEKENQALSLSEFQALEDRSARVQTPEENVLVATAVDNKLSSRDLALVLEKLYRGQLLDKKWTQYCLGVLARQTFNTRLPRSLPREVKVYHKTGTIAGVVNDVGILELEPGRGLVVVVLIQQVQEGEEGAAERLIADIASVAYKAYR